LIFFNPLTKVTFSRKSAMSLKKPACAVFFNFHGRLDARCGVGHRARGLDLQPQLVLDIGHFAVRRFRLQPQRA
jgi:hypothetical protein